MKIFTLAVSLGAAESLIDVPVMMTQGCNGVSEESLQERGINIGLIRLSIGIEDVNDLIDDLNQALDKYWILFVNNVTFQNNDTLIQEKVNGKVNGEINGEINGKVNGKVNGEINGKVNGKVNGQVNGKVNGQVNGKVNGNESNLRKNTVIEMLRRNLML